MVLSKMYCSEQIVIPEQISNLLKTYAKGKNSHFIFYPEKQLKMLGDGKKNKLKTFENSEKKIFGLGI